MQKFLKSKALILALSLIVKPTLASPLMQEEQVQASDLTRYSNAVRGGLQAQYEEGERAYILWQQNKKDEVYASALDWLSKLAQQGHQEAETLYLSIMNPSFSTKEETRFTPTFSIQDADRHYNVSTNQASIRYETNKVTNHERQNIRGMPQETLPKIPKEIYVNIFNYLSNSQSFNLEALKSLFLVNKEYHKLIKQKIEDERVKTFNNLPQKSMDRYLSIISNAHSQDLQWLRLERILARMPLPQIYNKKEAHNYIKNAVKYFKACQRGAIGKPLESLGYYEAIYQASLLLKDFMSEEEDKLLFSRLLLYASRLQSDFLRDEAVENIKSFEISENVRPFAYYYLYQYQNGILNIENIKKIETEISKVNLQHYKILKIQFNLADHLYENAKKENDEAKKSEYFQSAFIRFKECKKNILKEIKYSIIIDDGETNKDDLIKNKTEEELFLSNFFDRLRFLSRDKETPRDEAELSKLLKVFINTVRRQVLMYYHGQGIERDLEHVVKISEILSSYNDVKSHFNLGCLYSSEYKDYERAFKYYKMAAEQGYSDAMTNIAWMHFAGEGVKRNYKEAFNWYMKAARYNNSNAQSNLGDMYRNGQGVEVDYKQAFDWYYKALNNEEPVANFHVGWLYDKGLGVERDPQKATSFYTKAWEAIRSSNKLFLKFTQDTVGDMCRYGLGTKKDVPLAIQYYLKAINQNYGLSQAKLGRMYKEGWAIFSDPRLENIREPANLNIALKYLWQASAQDETEGYYNLALMYRDGEGVEQDDTEALRLLSLAADQMHGDALYTLGWMHEHGRGIEKDSERAQYWYKKGEERYPADALYSLGRMYELGLSVEINLPEAIKWYYKGATLYHIEAKEKLAWLINRL